MSELGSIRLTRNISEFAICHVVHHDNVNSIQNPSTVTNPTMQPYCILLPLTLPCRTTWQIANSLLYVNDITLLWYRTKYNQGSINKLGIICAASPRFVDATSSNQVLSTINETKCYIYVLFHFIYLFFVF